MKGKLGSALFCLAFAIPFGLVGLGATYVAATMIYDGVRAQDWVRVKADVLGDTNYRYAFDGKTYTNDRLGTLRIGGTSDVDDFDERVASILAYGREEKKPITVFVNPDNPAESMIDRTIRWGFLVFLLPFSLVFGAVGVAGIYMLSRVVREPDKPQRGAQRQARHVRAAAMSNAASGVGGLWFFALVWNGIAFPVAALAVPDAIRSGDWVVLFVLIFPLIGLLVLWGAIAATFNRLRRGRAKFTLATGTPRVGSPLEGHFEFARGVRAGDSFTARLVCERTTRNGEETNIATHWAKAVQVKAIAAPTGMRVPFRVEVPSSLPASDEDDDERPLSHRWRVELEPKGRSMVVPYKEEVVMAPPAFDAPRPLADDREPAARIDPSLEQVLGKGLTAEQRAALSQMAPEHQAKLAKLLGLAPSARKIVIAVICLVVAVEVVPLIFSLAR